MELRLRDSAFTIPHDLVPGAEGAPGELFEAMGRRIRDSAFVTPHVLFSGAECAPIRDSAFIIPTLVCTTDRVSNSLPYSIFKHDNTLVISDNFLITLVCTTAHVHTM